MMKILMMMLFAVPAFAQGPGGFGGPGGPGGPGGFGGPGGPGRSGLNCRSAEDCYRDGKQDGHREAEAEAQQRRNAYMTCSVTVQSGFNPGGPGRPGRNGNFGQRTFQGAGYGEVQAILALYDQTAAAAPGMFGGVDIQTSALARNAIKANQYQCTFVPTR